MILSDVDHQTQILCLCLSGVAVFVCAVSRVDGD